MPHLYILTLNWNGADKLSKLYQSMLPALSDIDWTWVVKDNASKDNSLEQIKSWNNPRIKLLEFENNLQNFSQGVNYCFRAIQPKDDDLVLLLNNDITFGDTTSLHRMIALLKHDVGVVGARLLYPGTKTLQHAGVVFGGPNLTPFNYRTGQPSDLHAFANRTFQAVTGAILLIRVSDFRQAGMDENYHWAFDDVDLCLSVLYHLNKQVVYCGSTTIYHEESSTLKKNPQHRLFLQHNLHYLKHKWSGRYIADKILYEANANHNLFH